MHYFFRSLQRLLRVSAYVLRFVFNLERKEASDYLIDGKMEQYEVHEERKVWCKEIEKVVVDFAGPLYAKDVFSKKGEINKVCIALFTCAILRAVHLELMPSLS